LIFFPPAQRLHEGMQCLVYYLRDIICEKAAQDPALHHNIITHMVHAADTEEGKLSMEEIIATTITFFIAGHETTATTLLWIIYELSQNQHVQEKLFQEIQNKIGNRNPDFDEIHLEYLECVLSENLRLHSPLGIFPARVAITDLEYNGNIIPKGALLSVNVYSLHRNPEIWPDPDKFDPDRFSNENKKNRHRFAYIPFSAGTRQCIGMNFSLIEQRVFLIRLLQRFKILPSKVGPSLSVRNGPFLNQRPEVCVYLQSRDNYSDK